MYTHKLQLVNPRVKLEQIVRQNQEMSTKARELVAAILTYICEQRVLKAKHKHVKYYDSQALIRNQLDLRKVTGGLYTNVSNKYDRNKFIKKAITELVDKDIITPIDGPRSPKNTNYLINPLFYYDGFSFLNVYLHWCYLTNTQPKNVYVEECYKVGEHFEEVDMGLVSSMLEKGICEY